MKFLSLFIYSICLILAPLQAREKITYVYLKDKKNVSFNPESFFDAKAIQRRKKMNWPLYEYSDFPVSEIYLSQLTQQNIKIIGKSRWLNLVAIEASNEQLIWLTKQAFVDQIITADSTCLDICQSSESGYVLDPILIKEQISHLQGAHFNDKNLMGKGIRVAVFDVGYKGLKNHEAFKHLFQNQLIKKTFDFARKKQDVYDYGTHGTNVMSCISGVYQDKPLGLATESEFLLAITEFPKREPYAEEIFWLEAAEWADQHGADIINSSLGYTNTRYFPKDMNGQTSLVSQAARMATRRGILVINAAGNEGDGSWQKIGTPADVDSVLTVGGINPYTGYRISFSSEGPNMKGQKKPNVSAFGQAIVASEKAYESSFGTSFSAPLISGFAACVWGMDTSLKNMDVFNKIEQSAHLYPYFDYAHGYGVPQASFFNQKKSSARDTTFDIKETQGAWEIVLRHAYFDSSKTQKPFTGENTGDAMEVLQDHIQKEGRAYIYMHIEGIDGILREYKLVEAFETTAFRIPFYELERGETLRIHFKGFTYSKKL